MIPPNLAYVLLWGGGAEIAQDHNLQKQRLASLGSLSNQGSRSQVSHQPQVEPQALQHLLAGNAALTAGLRQHQAETTKI